MGRKKKHIVVHKEQDKLKNTAETEPISGEQQKPKPKPKPIQNWEGEGGAVIPTGKLPPIKDVHQNK